MERVEVYPKKSQRVELPDTDFKRTVVHMFKENKQDGRSFVEN